MMAASRESFFAKLLLFLYCSSTTVIICQSQLQGFTCFSSTDCHGNKVDVDISIISECCAIGAGLSFEEITGECGNCFTDEKFESRGEKFYLSIFSNYEVVEYFRIGEIRLAVEPVGRESTTFMVDALGQQVVHTAPVEVTLESSMLELESVGTRNRGIFIKSENGDSLSVVAFVEEFQSSDTFKVYPCVAQPVTAYEYYAVSVPQSVIVLPPDPDYADDPDYEPEVLDPQGNSAIVIVTTEENTVLNVTLTQDVSISEARDIVEQIGTDLLRSGEQVSFQLPGRSTTLYLASLDDLTGSRVSSNKPITFITGHECGTLPHNIQYCDHLVEQITPTSTWGKEFIISTIATRKEVDTFRIIASRSDTSVSVACTITDVPPLNLNMAGSYVEFHVNSTDSCYLESNQPILVAQFSVSSLVDKVFNSDPFLVIVPPIEQYRSSYVFNTFTGSPFNPGVNYINILLPAGVEIEGLRLDGGILPDDATVTPIQCLDSDTICATTVQVRVSDDRHDLNHIDSSAQFSAIVYWLSFRVAHGYPIGMTQKPIALPSVSLERSNSFVFENDSVVVLRLTREGDTSVPGTVFVSTTEITNGGNALSGEDFVAVSQLAVDFGPNQTEAFFTIEIVDDVFPESTEEFEVFLSASAGVNIVSPAYANVTILNDDPPLPVMNVSFAETNIEIMEGVGLVMLTLEKTLGALGPVAVRVFTTSESAVDGEDFVAIDDIVTFEIEDLMATIVVLVLDNLSLEDIEEFTVHIEPVMGDFPVAVQNSTTTVNIRDNDVVVLGFEQPTYTVSEENDGEFRVSVIISHGSLERSIIATVETISGSAIGSEDFVPMTRVLSFDSTTTEQSISVSIINDNQVEVNEEFNVRLVLEEEDSSNIIASPVEAVITILDTDRVEIDLLPIATTVREAEGSARVNVSVMEGRLGGPLSVALTTFNINSTGGEDYTEVSTVITLSPSNSFQEVLIPITDDTVYDGPDDEKFLIAATLMPGQNTERVDLQVSTQTITIVDNEPTPIALVGFSEASYTTVEDAREIVLLVESDGINHDLFTVDFSYQTGEAQDGSDIIFPAGSLQFPPGSRTGVITVPIVDDGRAELTETFTVQLQSSDAISLMTDSTTVTIIDNDVVDVGFGQMVYSVTEGQNAEIVLTITKTTLTDRTVSVMFSTLDGTALAGVDYEGLTELLTFPPNVNTREVTVSILNNQLPDPGSRLFFGELRSVSSTGVNISLPTASILIADDDLSNTLSRPINFEAIAQATVVEFSWEQPSVDMVDNYVLMWTYLSPCERSSTQSVLLDGAARQHTLEGLEENSTYSFRLQARNSAVVSPDAVLEVATLTAAPSGPPQSLQGISTTSTSITIEWNDIICLDQNGAITSYDVRVNGRIALTTFQRQATITGLSSSTSYFIDVRGNNSIGGGPFSPTARITTAGAENVSVSFDQSEYTVSEGETVFVGVRLSGPVSVQTVVRLLTIDRTAEGLEDYILSDSSVTFAPGVFEQFIPILTVNDSIGESDETFDVVFSPISSNVNIGAISLSTIVIIDDDPNFSLECIQFTVSPSGPFQIACQPMNGEVESVECDYNSGLTDEPCGLSFSVDLTQFEPGPLSLTITATSTEGETDTDSFTFTVPEPLSLDCSSGGVSGRVTVSCTTSRGLFQPPFCELTGVGVIQPCDLDNIELNVVDFPPGVYNLTIFVVDVLELTATETVLVLLTEPLFNIGCMVNGTTVSCSSTVDGTMVQVSYQCSIDGETAMSCEPPFTIAGETLKAGSHNLIILATTLGGQTRLIDLPFIIEVQFTFRHPMYLFIENGGTGTVCIDKIGETDQTVTLMVSGSLQAETGMNIDQPVTFAPNEMSQCIDFDIIDDIIALEETETFVWSLGILTPSPGVQLGEFNTTTIGILDDDELIVTLEKSPNLPENIGVAEACITFSNPYARSFGIVPGTSSMNMSADFSIATPFEDYIPPDFGFVADMDASDAGRICYDAATIVDDLLVEDQLQCFIVNFSIPDDIPMLIVQNSSTICCIEDNDVVTIGFVPDEYSVAESTGEVTLIVQIVDGQLERSVQVDFTTSDGSATSIAPVDFIDPGNGTLQFSNSTTSQSIRITIENDDILENDENFLGNLTTLDGSVRLDPEQAEVTILEDNDDTTIGFDPDSYTVNEDDGSATLTVRLISGTLEREVTVFFETTPGTADSEQDYTRTTEVLIFSPGVSSVDVIVPILQDDIVEDDEVFFGNLDGQGQPVFVAPDVATVTIQDDNDNTMITCDSTVVLQSTRITCTSTRPLSQDPPPLCVIGTTGGFCDISNFVVTTDVFPAGNLNLTITAQDRQGFMIVHTFPFVLIECEPLGAVRLVGGSNGMEGRVEVCDGVVWGTVCDDQWDNQDAMVVCRQLGLPTQGAIARTGSFFGQGSGPIVLDNVQCTGSETGILDCTANPIGVHNCNHEQDAGVTCVPSTPSPTTPPDSELVECFVDQNCQDDATPLEVTRRECCVGNPAGAGFRSVGEEACNVCVVFGFFNTTFTAPEQGQGYSLPVGYLKRPRANNVGVLTFAVTQEFVTANMSDFILLTSQIAVLPTQPEPRSVTFTFLVDVIAQERNETVTLRLIASEAVNNRFGSEYNNTVFFLDTVELTILDSDTVDISFTDEDYRSAEPDLLMNVRVTKNTRIATPVTVRVTPVNISQHSTTGRGFPSALAEDNPVLLRLSPIEADENDFDNSVIVVTFQPDETGQQINDINTPVAITNDAINEAEEQNFVVTLDIVSAIDESSVTTVRKDAVCRIIDDDDIAIGFEEPSYIFTEPETELDVFDEVYLAKEGGVISEQTFQIVVTVSGGTPDSTIRAAERSMDGSDNDYTVGASNFVQLEIDPDEQRIPFIFRLFGDDIAEGTEAFQASPAARENSPNFLQPTVLSANTFIIIEDDDFVIIGFERGLYSVSESVGSQEICVVVTFPAPDVPILTDITLSVNTMEGTANEMDYGRIAEQDFSVFLSFDNENRRACFNLQINDDGLVEDTESLTMDLVFSSFFPAPSGVRLDPNVTTVEIMDDDVPTTTPTLCNDGDVRLRDGFTEREGRVEICFDEAWGTVCDDRWDDNDAAVVCRQLGFSSGDAIAVTDAFYGLGVGPIHLDEVQCDGDEARLADCTHNGIGNENCEHFEDAGVEC